ncbi:AP-1 complex-associated regulatory protein-like isoform X2 [Myxocyprinus asiaticus]|uniref:AP-1 complex-associated regulatory protein-like isoform X2 n=1 Tax=Myxocyprinus asiaticus TaxID=70543 RepID=UPI0022231121|nr:AP-1 complex-associated regulatory protein-like isoform X2 [Myxocyprinus asiaticus]XP_051506362.1 AP-1 complex-associated regulatory protein-like isoform X2 [Myxocyprinus asiaticus]
MFISLNKNVYLKTLEPISEEEICHLKKHRYAAISDKQVLIDEKLNAELVAEEEKLRLEEEAVFAAQREAARLAKEQKLKERKQHQQRTKPRTEPEGNDPRPKPKRSDGEFEVYLQSVKAPSEVCRSNRLSSETNVVTPNTESSWDFTSKTDATSLDLEWEDEEGMNQMGPAWERSKTEEDILRAALRPGRKQLGSGPTSTSEDSNALEWENDFVSAHPEDSGDHGDEDFEGFVNPVLDMPTEETELKPSSDQQERESS